MQGWAQPSARGKTLQNSCSLCESDVGASGTHPRASPCPQGSHTPARRSPSIHLPCVRLTIWNVSLACLFIVCPRPQGSGVCLTCCCTPGAGRRTSALSLLNEQVHVSPQPAHSSTCQSLAKSLHPAISFNPHTILPVSRGAASCKAGAQQPHHRDCLCVLLCLSLQSKGRGIRLSPSLAKKPLVLQSGPPRLRTEGGKEP